jgi:hypothetical protein
LFKWVGWFTGSKNAMKGADFFVGAPVARNHDFRGAFWSMERALALILVGVCAFRYFHLGGLPLSRQLFGGR